MTAYYNEVDPYAAQWLRNLITAEHIAPGDVDERSIEDVKPDDLRKYTQCHFFAGVGVWSLALRRAGWPDDRAVWTGSCPCQPFSAAGQSGGFDDERHLWPAWHWLITQCKPAAVFGEQVASKAADDWIDLVSFDLEGMGYAVGAVAFPSAGVGAPHIRDRTYWMADARHNHDARQSNPASAGQPQTDRPSNIVSGRGCAPDRVEHTQGDGWQQRRTESGRGSIAAGCAFSGMADAESDRHEWAREFSEQTRENGAAHCGPTGNGSSPTNGMWAEADWLFCRDGKWRPIEPGTFPLAHGAPARVGRLRAYGNAINAEAARAFIEASGLI